MPIWSNLVLAVQLVSAIAMIGLVLLQQGKGADMGASFGSGASGSLFGATGSANFLSRTTAVCATVFFLSTLGLALINTGGGVARSANEGSILDRAVPAVVAPSGPAGAVIPGAGPAPAITGGEAAAAAAAGAASTAAGAAMDGAASAVAAPAPAAAASR